MYARFAIAVLSLTLGIGSFARASLMIDLRIAPGQSPDGEKRFPAEIPGEFSVAIYATITGKPTMPCD